MFLIDLANYIEKEINEGTIYINYQPLKENNSIALFTSDNGNIDNYIDTLDINIQFIIKNESQKKAIDISTKIFKSLKKIKYQKIEDALILGCFPYFPILFSLDDKGNVEYSLNAQLILKNYL